MTKVCNKKNRIKEHSFKIKRKKMNFIREND